MVPHADALPDQPVGNVRMAEIIGLGVSSEARHIILARAAAAAKVGDEQDKQDEQRRRRAAGTQQPDPPHLALSARHASFFSEASRALLASASSATACATSCAARTCAHATRPTAAARPSRIARCSVTPGTTP